MKKVLCLAVAGLLLSSSRTSAHRIEYYTGTGCIVPGSSLVIDALVVYAPSNTQYRWQYKASGGSWTCFNNGANNINGTSFNVSNASGSGANNAPALTISNPSASLDNVQIRCLMRENYSPCNAPSGTTWGGDDLNQSETKVLRLRYNSNTGACSISCADNLLTNSDGYYGGFENVTYSNGNYTNKNFLSGAGSSDYNNGGSSSGSFRVMNNPYAAYGFSNAKYAPHGGNYQMIVKGNTNQNDDIWYKTISVQPGDVYSFSVWVSRVDNTKPRIQLKAGSTELIATQITASAGNWVQVTGTYTVPSGTSSVKFTIRDKDACYGAHNYVMDDICLVQTAQPITIGDKVWFDVDRDGRQDAGEPGIGGVTVKLYYDGNNNNIADSSNATMTTTTNSSGNYSFTGVLPGKYFVQFTLASGYDAFTTQDASGVPVGQNSTANVTTGKTGTHNFTADYLYKDAGMVKNFGISGKVFNDVDGLTDNTVDGTLISSLNGTALHANLFKGNVFVATVPVSNGIYTFDNLPGNTDYTVSISTVAGNTSSSPSSVLATGWVNTGEHQGSGAGNDGTVDGLLNINLAATGISNANFGIEQLPTPVSNTAPDQANPGGTNSVTVPPATFSGTDPSGGTITSLRITAFPTGATSITINGTVYTASNFPGAGVTVPTNTSGQPTQPILVDPAATGNTTVTIPFKVTDNAGKESTSTGTATIPFVSYTISGKVFNDVNGMTDNNVNGSGIGLTSSLQLNAYLVLASGGTIVDSVPVATNGTFVFENASGNTSYVVMVTTANVAIGGNSPALTLPSGWIYTGEKLGSGTGSDGNANGALAVTVTNSNVTNARFGMEERPTASIATALPQVNPGDTISVTVPPATFVASDVAPGTVTSIKITALPSNANSITVGSVKYTAATFPAGGIIIPADASGQPTEVIKVDPVNGTVTAGIPFQPRDNANAFSTDTGLAKVPVYEVPDLTPVITLAPTTMYGTTNFVNRVDIWNLGEVSTSGTITVYLTKSALIGYTFNSALTFAAGAAVQNNVWSLDATSNPNYYIFTTNTVIEPQSRSSFGLNGVLTPASTEGQLNNTVIIGPGSGSEANFLNNSDAEIIYYFQN